MNLATKLLICIALCYMGTVLVAKSFFKKAVNFVTTSPIKTVTKAITGAKPLIPTSVYDIKTDFIDNFDVVQDGVFYRSAQLSRTALKDYMHKYGIKTVINLRGEHPGEKWWQQEKEVVENNGGVLFNIFTSASKLTSKNNIRKILKIFDTAPRPMLVHCQAGIDRTGEIAALWVLDQQHKSNKKAAEQLSLWHRHSSYLYPAKDILIKNWRGRTWFEKEYNPANYPQFDVDKD